MRGWGVGGNFYIPISDHGRWGSLLALNLFLGCSPFTFSCTSIELVNGSLFALNGLPGNVPPATFPSIRRSGRIISLIFTHMDILTVRLLAAFQASQSKPAWTRLNSSDPKGKGHRPPPPGKRSSLMKCVRWVSERGVSACFPRRN
jgi:hypothetical protein